MQTRTGAISFPKAKDTGPRTASTTLVFDQNKRIVEAVACLTGFNAEFSDFKDHNFGKLQVQVQSTVLENTVTVVATYGLRDNGETYDNDYNGTVYFAVIVNDLPL